MTWSWAGKDSPPLAGASMVPTATSENPENNLEVCLFATLKLAHLPLRLLFLTLPSIIRLGQFRTKSN